MRSVLSSILWLIPGVFFLTLTTARADWERDLGLKAGYDSNLDRAISNPQGSGYLSGFFSLNREPDGESRWDWSLGTQIEGTTYFNLTDLNSAAVTLAPGLTFFPHKDWLINVSPFGQAKSVGDSEQSALAFGGKISLKQRWGGGVYTGQYYLYRDNRAQVDTYSYSENALGVYLGLKWSAKFFGEVGYEYSQGDSFLSIGQKVPSGTGGGSGGGPAGGTGGVPGSGAGVGSGGEAGGGTGSGGAGGGRNNATSQWKTPRYSSAFGSTVVRENVNRHALGVALGIDWNKSLYSLAGYSFTTLQGESGNVFNHAIFLTTGYRF